MVRKSTEAFTYSPSWPYAFSAPFAQYVNAGISGDIGYFEQNEACIPYIFKAKAIFNIVYILTKPYSIQRDLTPNEEAEVLQAFFAYSSKELNAHFIQSTLHVCTYQLPKLSGLKPANIGIVRVVLQGKTADDVFAGFQGQYRNIIRKAEKEGVEMKTGIQYLQDFYNLYETRLKHEKAPYDSLAAIKTLLQDESLHPNIYCAVAYLNGEADAALLNFSGGGITYNMYAASRLKALHKGSLKLLHWNAMKHDIVNGVKLYQFGGVRLDEKNEKLENIVDFKMRFGAEIEHGQHFVYVISSLYYNLYTSLMKLRNLIAK